MDTNSSSFDFSRRKFLHRCGMGMGALGLEGILQADSAVNPVRNHFPIRASRVIHFFLNVCPSHVDTFDPKPSLEKYAEKELPFGKLLSLIHISEPTRPY